MSLLDKRLRLLPGLSLEWFALREEDKPTHVTEAKANFYSHDEPAEELTLKIHNPTDQVITLDSSVPFLY